MHVNGLAKPGTESRAIIITTAMHSYMQAENKMINDPIVKLSSSQFHVHMCMYITDDRSTDTDTDTDRITHYLHYRST